MIALRISRHDEPYGDTEPIGSGVKALLLHVPV